MQFDRLMSKTVTRLAKSGIAGLRKTAPAAPAPVPAPKDDLRGSGSWANEWGGARAAMARAKLLAAKGKTAKAKVGSPPDAIPEGTITARPLMSSRDVRLHTWILDRMEAEAPCCTLHAGVALRAFLASATAHETHDPLAGLVADMLIVDETGQPIAALIREASTDPARQLLVMDALMDADIPIIDIPARPSLATLWTAIAQVLPAD